ncbi:MAG TPA: type I methionyl aminopeptidase [Candidatus Omnitrophota bacterium]|nr:type I methionyl aminopeptidase [Candidatus Omnitrophota bacterium]
MIPLKTKSEIDAMRKAGKALAKIVCSLRSSLKIGLTTFDINCLAEDLINKKGAVAAFKGYRGYPAAICTSFNEEVVHGIPSQRKIKEGDILSIDVGLIVDGWFSDMAFSVGFGELDDSHKKLLEVTERSLYQGIQQMACGNYLSDIGFAIQSYVEPFGFSVVRDFVGHGIGRALHEDPEVPNFGLPRSGPILKEGMVFAVEPMVNKGAARTRILDDHWTVVTYDGQPSAHFEHTVAITSQGPEILTQV